MKTENVEFTIHDETSLLGFETEQVYKISVKNTNEKICNIFEDKYGGFRVASVCHADINILIEALKFAKRKIK